MIGSVRGDVLARRPSGDVLVEVGGLGYRVIVTPRTLAAVPSKGEVFLFTHHHIREDAELLYGFLTADEQGCFESLISAHGVGPALALAILGVHTPDALRVAVSTNDEASLCLVPGVGKKTAQRLMIELRSKLDVTIDANNSGANGHSSVTGDLREALVSLGYSTDEIRDTLRDLAPAVDAATGLREALRLLGKNRA